MWEWWNSLESVTRFRWWIHILLWVTPLLFLFILGGLRILADYRREQLITQRQQVLAKPRQLSPQQQGQFFDIVKEAPRCILIQSPTGDSEALALASELGMLLRNAGWEVDGHLGETVFNPPLFGIQIQLDRAPESEEKFREIAETEISVLKRALHAAGIPQTSTTSHIGLDTVPYKGIKLYIGQKPVPSD
jgi:hypothetical protein